jgi:hypothetical protein
MSMVQAGDAVAFVVPHGHEFTLFGTPLGNISIFEAVDAVQKVTGKSVVACERIPRDAIAEMQSQKDWQIIEDRDNFDYVYSCEDLATLSGRKYHKKRNLIAQCLKEYDCTYESYSAEMVPALKDMQSRWCKAHNCGTTPSLCQEYQAINEALNHAGDLDLVGGAVKIGGAVQAYALGSKLNDTTVAIHFEKAMPEFKGLYQLINHWVCQHEFAGYEFVNREQDLGVEGLRKAKESYFPEMLVEKFVLLKGLSFEEYMKNRVRAHKCTASQ